VLAGCEGLPAFSARTSRGSTRVGSIPIVCVEDGAPFRCDATRHLGEQNRATARLGWKGERHRSHVTRVTDGTDNCASGAVV
jgi:hypothetical protein